MKFYKVILDGKIIDVFDNAVFVKINPRGRVVICGSDEAVGVVSSDSATIWGLTGTAGLPGIATENVTIAAIDKEEADEIKTLLGLGGEVTDIPGGNEVEFPEEPVPANPAIDGTLVEVKKRVLEKLNATCQQVIFDGFDATLANGEVKHFTLKVEDQLNLLSLSALLATGVDAIPYHATGELCEYYSAEDMSLIVAQATQFKTYHTSYFNSLKNWVESMDSIAEVGAVEYGDIVPEEFCSVVLNQLMQAQEAG